MFTATKDKALQTTTTGALPRPSWYTENLRGLTLSRGFAHRAYREQHFDCLAANVAAQHRAGIDIMVDGDTRLDDDVAGRSWVAYATERIEGIGAPRIEVQPAGFMADKQPGDIMWEVIETRLTPPVNGPIGATRLELDRAYRAMAGMTDRPIKIGSVSAQILALMLANEYYADRIELLNALSEALNREYRYRYDKDRDHASIGVMGEILHHRYESNGLTEFAQAMPDQYKVPGDAVSAYRAFYLGEKYPFARWTRRPAPHWWTADAA
jgi:5-methyltetrahydropteroyltriglutamate--homocysteine methyltransferase